MENLNSTSCKSITLFCWGYYWRSNAGESEPIWVSTGLDINTGQETGYWQESSNTCGQGWC